MEKDINKFNELFSNTLTTQLDLNVGIFNVYSTNDYTSTVSSYLPITESFFTEDLDLDFSTEELAKKSTKSLIEKMEVYNKANRCVLLRTAILSDHGLALSDFYDDVLQRIEVAKVEKRNK